MKIKTIDINLKEWFDKVNGNSYFSGQITINYGMKGSKVFYLPFQYGYEDFGFYQAAKFLQEKKILKDDYNKIIWRKSKQENCKKKEVAQWGTAPAVAMIHVEETCPHCDTITSKKIPVSDLPFIKCRGCKRKILTCNVCGVLSEGGDCEGCVKGSKFKL